MVRARSARPPRSSPDTGTGTGSTEVKRSKPGTTVLFVDDDETTRRTMTVLLEDEGYAVSTASDGTRALELFDATGPSVVITDLEMPGLPGDALTWQIRQRSPATPVFLISGRPTRDAKRAALHAGATHFLSKPLDVVAFLELLERYR